VFAKKDYVCGMNQLEQEFINVGKTGNLRNEKREEWLKQVLLCATTLLGILISLHKEKSDNELEHYLFCSTIGIISLGILSGSITLFSNVNALHRFVRKRTKELLSDEKVQYSNTHIAKPYKVFDLARNICYISFFLSIPILVWYAILLDK
jgi:hypothetical protein